MKGAQRPAGILARGVEKSFGGEPVLAGLDLEVAPGEFVALLGASGSGKSTVLRLLAGLEDPDAGELSVDGRLGYAFQESRLLPWLRVRDNVLFGLREPRGRTARRDIAERALAEVDLSHRGEAWPGTLSGGEAQRASLARALVRDPEILLLDEPFGALDALTRIVMQRLVLDLWAAHRPSIVLVTHDVSEALRLADRVLLLEDGVIAAEHRVTAARPRAADDPALLRLQARLLAGLGVEG